MAGTKSAPVGLSAEQKASGAAVGAVGVVLTVTVTDVGVL